MAENTPSRFAQNVGIFTSATLLSRILGYVRDALVAATFGGGMVTDAFYAAFKVPNLLRRFMGEGAMTAAFVPVFTDVLTKKGEEEANRFFNALLIGIGVALSGVVAVGILFAPQVTRVVAWGFVRTPEVFDLTSDLVRLTFPFLVVISMAALVTAVLNARGRFFVPALSPAGLSVAEIGFIVVLASRMDSPVHGLAASVVVGGALHFVAQLPSLYKEGFFLRWAKPFSHPGVKSVLLLMGPAILGLAADQINSFVDQFCASFLREGSITALYNSNRVMQLPLALFGIAVSSVALPSLSRSMSQNDLSGFKSLLNFSVRIANYILIPSFFGLLAVGYPIVQILFEHGKFTETYSRMTYLALAPYAFGLPAYSTVRILATAFYARKNTRTPMRVAFWAMGLHVALNVALMWRFEVAGLAFSTAASAWFQAVVLFVLLRREVGPLGGRTLASSFLYGSAAGLVMGAVCWWMSFRLLDGQALVLRVAGPIAAGAAFYFLLSKLLRVKEYDILLNTLRRRKIQD